MVAAATEARLATIGPPQPDVPPDPDTWIAAFGRLPLLAQPGDPWLYNTGAHVLSVLLARAAELPLPEVLRTRLFEPLGMTDTGFWTAETDRLATADAATPDGLTVWDAPDGSGAGRRRSPTAPPGWYQQPTTCGREESLGQHDDVELTGRVDEERQAPQMHTDLQKAAYDIRA